jgi:hypothetical protein
VNAPAKRLDPLGQAGHIYLLLRLCIELAQLLSQAMLSLGHLLSFALELFLSDHLGQVHVE